MRRNLMICLLTVLVAFPLMAAAQPAGTTGPTSEYNPDAGRLMPKGAYPNRPSAQVMPSETMSQQNTVRDAQIALLDAGYEPGQIDGMMGPRTQAAIREFQASYGLPQTGRLDEPTQRQLFAARTPQSGSRR